MQNGLVQCPITGHKATKQYSSNFDLIWFTYEDSNVNYAITEEALRALSSEEKDNYQLKSNLAHELVKACYSGKRMIFSEQELSEKTKNNILRDCVKIYSISSIYEFYKTVNANERPLLLLKRSSIIAKQNKNPFLPISLSIIDMFYCKILTNEEMLVWLNHLENQGLLSLKRETIGHSNISFSLKPLGLRYEENEKIISNTVFIAMSFDVTMQDNRTSIMKSVRSCGLEPKIVSEVEYLGGIVDKIENLISESLFVIADFTGHKNGVYYEAGIAEGKNKPVIYMGQKEDMENSHFDIKHLNQIRYVDLNDLENRLTERIKYLLSTLNNR